MTRRETPERRNVADIRLLQVLGFLYVASCLLESVSLGPTTPAQVFGLAFIGVWLGELVIGLRTPRVVGWQLLPFLILVVWMLVTTYWSVVPSNAVLQAATTMLLVISAIAVADVFQNRFRQVAYALVAGGLIIAILILLSPEGAAVEDYFVDHGTAQATIAGIDENILAFQLTIAVAAGCYLLMTVRQLRGQLCALFATALMVAATLRIGSKTGVVALIAIAVIMVLLQARSLKAITIAIVTVGCGIALFVGLSSIGLIPLRVLDYLDNPQVIDSRLEIVDTFMLFRDQWQIVGVGAGGDADFLAEYTGTFLNAHGAHWKVWIELGLIGVVCWVMILVVLVIGTTKLADKRLVILAAAPIAAYAWSLGTLNSNTFWVIIGLTLSGFALSRGTPDEVAPKIDAATSAQILARTGQT